jgi:hypothetical protein
MFKLKQKNSSLKSHYSTQNVQNVGYKNLLFSRNKLRISDPVVKERLKMMSYIESLAQSSSQIRN